MVKTLNAVVALSAVDGSYWTIDSTLPTILGYGKQVVRSQHTVVYGWVATRNLKVLLIDFVAWNVLWYDTRIDAGRGNHQNDYRNVQYYLKWQNDEVSFEAQINFECDCRCIDKDEGCEEAPH